MTEKSQKKIEVKTPAKQDKNFARKYQPIDVLPEEVAEPILLSVSEAAKLGGITTKTIRRAIQSNLLRYTVVKDRYLIDFRSVIRFLHTKRKLKNKLEQSGIGQYIREWRD